MGSKRVETEAGSDKMANIVRSALTVVAGAQTYRHAQNESEC